MLKHSSFKFKMESGSLQEREFHGYLSTFGNVDSDGDVIAPGAWTESLPFFIDKGRILWQHEQRTPIGKLVSAREDQKGLFIHARLSDVPKGQEALTLMRDEVMDSLSIGFEVKASEDLERERGVAILGEAGYVEGVSRAWNGKLRLITKGKPWEGSVVTWGADSQALISAVKCNSEREFERLLLDFGFSRKQAVAIANHGWKGLRDAEPLSLADQRDAGSEHQATIAALKRLQVALTT